MLKGALPARSSLSRNLCLWPHLCSPPPFLFHPHDSACPSLPSHHTGHHHAHHTASSKHELRERCEASEPRGPALRCDPKPPQARARTLAY